MEKTWELRKVTGSIGLREINFIFRKLKMNTWNVEVIVPKMGSWPRDKALSFQNSSALRMQKTICFGVVENPGIQNNIQVGWTIRLVFDQDDTKGFFLIFSDPDKVEDGYDNWFLSKVDAFLSIKDWGMEIKWMPNSSRGNHRK